MHYMPHVPTVGRIFESETLAMHTRAHLHTNFRIQTSRDSVASSNFMVLRCRFDEDAIILQINNRLDRRVSNAKVKGKSKEVNRLPSTSNAIETTNNSRKLKRTNAKIKRQNKCVQWSVAWNRMEWSGSGRKCLLNACDDIDYWHLIIWIHTVTKWYIIYTSVSTLDRVLEQRAHDQSLLFPCCCWSTVRQSFIVWRMRMMNLPAAILVFAVLA